jgi:hypothetical protein
LKEVVYPVSKLKKKRRTVAKVRGENVDFFLVKKEKVYFPS